MTAYSAINPLPMRIPATDPPVAGDHVDIGVWPGGWTFLTRADRERFERMPADQQEIYADVYAGQAAAMAVMAREESERRDTFRSEPQA